MDATSTGTSTGTATLTAPHHRSRFACCAGSPARTHLALAAGRGRHVDKAAGVLLALVRAALGRLLRLLRLDLGGLRLDLAGTRQTAVNLAHDECGVVLLLRVFWSVVLEWFGGCCVRCVRALSRCGDGGGDDEDGKFVVKSGNRAFLRRAGEKTARQAGELGGKGHVFATIGKVQLLWGPLKSVWAIVSLPSPYDSTTSPLELPLQALVPQNSGTKQA